MVLVRSARHLSLFYFEAQLSAVVPSPVALPSSANLWIRLLFSMNLTLNYDFFGDDIICGLLEQLLIEKRILEG